VALAFGVWIASRLGQEAGLTYLTAYLLEKSLSIDNLVVFALVFSQTGIPPSLQHRALFWGVIGALVMRAVLIVAGIYLLERFQWLVYPFGALLLYAAIRMFKGEGQAARPWVHNTCALCTSWVSRFIPIVPEQRGERFIVRIEGKRHATPLLVALVAIESADLVFAVDSIPAVLAVTRDPFLVYTSNVFALLGLRSLYAVIGNLAERFVYLRIGLAALLVFVAILAIAGAASRLLPEPSWRKGPRVSCPHRDQITNAQPTDSGCTKCKAMGDKWVQLRTCMTCGHVGCCDSSRNRHATRHFEETSHPIMRSMEKGENWKWCYVDRTIID
jgi:tellurite resistance protein TerC